MRTRALYRLQRNFVAGSEFPVRPRVRSKVMREEVAIPSVRSQMLACLRGDIVLRLRDCRPDEVGYLVLEQIDM